MKPQLAKTLGPKFTNFPCFVQPKLNGIRALYQNGTFQSRDEKIWKEGVLKHLVTELESQPRSDEAKDYILDGELYIHGWKLQKINGAVAVNRSEPREDTHLVEYHVFDVVNPAKPFSLRWLELADSIEKLNLPHIKIVPTWYANSRLEMESMFHHWTALGYEGVMLRPDGPYEFGETPHGTQKRSEYLWKHKQWEDEEFRCIGITLGEGKADIGIGALVLSAELQIPDDCLGPEDYMNKNEPPSFKVGTGFSDEDRTEYMKNPPIGKIVKVRYLCLTDSGIPFNPSFLCVMS